MDAPLTFAYSQGAAHELDREARVCGPEWRGAGATNGNPSLHSVLPLPPARWAPRPPWCTMRRGHDGGGGAQVSRRPARRPARTTASRRLAASPRSPRLASRAPHSALTAVPSRHPSLPVRHLTHTGCPHAPPQGSAQYVGVLLFGALLVHVCQMGAPAQIGEAVSERLSARPSARCRRTRRRRRRPPRA